MSPLTYPWATISICTLTLRLLVFPLVVKLRRNAIHMSLHSPKIAEFQEKITKYRRQGDNMQSAYVSMEMMEYMKQHNFNPLKRLLFPLAQAPVFMSMFLGIRRMALYPVESMKEGGLLWFTDLTAPDPYYGLPILTCASLLLVLETGSETGMKSQDFHVRMKLFMRALPVITLIITLSFPESFPSAVLTYWFTNNIISLAQIGVLKIPAIQRRLKLQDIVPVPSKPSSRVDKKKGFVRSVKDSFDDARAVSNIKYLEGADKKRFEEAGMGPIQKTYPYDPTKSKPTKNRRHVIKLKDRKY